MKKKSNNDDIIYRFIQDNKATIPDDGFSNDIKQKIGRQYRIPLFPYFIATIILILLTFLFFDMALWEYIPHIISYVSTHILSFIHWIVQFSHSFKLSAIHSSFYLELISVCGIIIFIILQKKVLSKDN